VGKGEETRRAILDRAVVLASRAGLEGLTIGGLAQELSLSKSGLFAHFRSKEVLQVETLRHAAEVFVDRVVRPALKSPRGERRLRALFDGWLSWAQEDLARGGCLFVAASTELDDRAGPARDELVRQQEDWMELIANVVRTAVKERQFRVDLDAEQFAYDLYGVMLVYHHARRLLRDAKAEVRARRAFEALVDAARAPRPAAARGPRARAS
jgi:AcrR family transcriptional regulator